MGLHACCIYEQPSMLYNNSNDSRKNNILYTTSHTSTIKSFGNFEGMLRLVKDFIVDVWEVRKQKLYGEDACPSHHQCQTLTGDAGPVTGGGGLRVSKMGKLQDKGKLGKLRVSFMYRYVVVIKMCMLVIVAPPIVMGVWSRAFLLGQHVEYYYIQPVVL